MTTRYRRLGMAACGGVLALACCAAALHAQQAPVAPAKAARAPVKAGDKPLWSHLSPAQKIALEPLQKEWDPLEGVRKQKWLELAKSYAAMKPEEQQRVHERMREWVRLTPAQRAAARQNYAQAKTLAPNEKSATWESYKQLPDEQKQKLAEQAARKQLTNLPPAKAAPRSLTPGPRTTPGVATPAAPAK